MRHRDVIDDLRRAYDRSAAERDRGEKSSWKLDERAGFAARLREGGFQRLLELGAGAGQDSAYFRDLGFTVVATDTSPAMVERCRARGIDAHVLDMTELDFPTASFDAAYAMNSLLHVPDADLPAVLERIRTLLVPGGLCYLGVYGGDGREGVWEQDPLRPRRFFSLRTDARIRELAEASFEIVDFHVITLGDASDGGDGNGKRFQSLTLRHRTDGHRAEGQRPGGPGTE